MAMFSKFKDMYKLQKQAKAAKKELKNIHIESEDEYVKVTVSAEQEIISIEIKEDNIQKEKLQDSVKKVLNKAMKKAQEIAGEKTKGMWKELGIAG